MFSITGTPLIKALPQEVYVMLAYSEGSQGYCFIRRRVVFLLGAPNVALIELCFSSMLFATGLMCGSFFSVILCAINL